MTDTLEIISHNSFDTMYHTKSDTLSGNTDFGSFINNGNAIISPTEISLNYEGDYIIYLILFLSGVVAFVWHFMPVRFKAVFSLSTERSLRINSQTPVYVGSIITAILSLNFFVVTGIFIYLILNRLQPHVFNGLSFLESVLYSYGLLFVLILFRSFIIYTLSFIFGTASMRRDQVFVSRNIMFITGVMLLPIIPILLYSSSIYIVYSVLFVILFLQLIRVIKTTLIGISNAMFSALHIILYLCALEIAPVLVLVRLIGNSSVF